MQNEPWPPPEPFFIEFGNHYLHGDVLPQETEKHPEILFLHGNWPKGRSEFLLLRHILWKHYGVSSCAFDGIGYGGTSGGHPAIELQTGIAQASDIIDACFDAQPLAIVAAGSNIQIALCLPEYFPIRHLMLINPDTENLSHTRVPCHTLTVLGGKDSLDTMNNDPALLAQIALTIKNKVQSNNTFANF